MHVLRIFCCVLAFFCLEARLKQPPRFVVKVLSLSEKNRIKKQVICKTSKEDELTALLISMQAVMICENLCLDEWEASLSTQVSIMHLAGESFKSFENALDQTTQPLVFVLSELQDKTLQKKHLRWLYNFFRKHPQKTIYLLKITQEIKIEPSSLHVFNWMPPKNTLPKDYSFGMTTPKSRSSSLEHAFCYL
jgi:hypothetical protein